jgi:hypothetical protein
MKLAIAGILTLPVFAQHTSTYSSLHLRPDGSSIRVSVNVGCLRVVDAPYSAEQITKETKADMTLSVDSEKIWRDGQGRTRSEKTIAAGFVLVEVDDPVDCLVYVIDKETKLVHRFGKSEPLVEPPPLEPGQVREAPRSAAPQRVRVGGTVQAAGPPPHVSVENLGERSFDGVVAQGTRTTSIPRSMVAVGEKWYSKELQMEVLSITPRDPMGEREVRVVNILRGEPDPSLFLAPVGYQIVDEKDEFTVTLKKR